MEHFFATCPRGLEALLIEDIQSIGASEITAASGGVHFSSNWSACYRLNLHSRIATRVLWRVAQGAYAKEDDVYRLAYNVAWREYFDVSKSIRVDVVAIKSPLKSLDFVALRIKDAVCDRFRADLNVRPNVNTREPDIRLHGFLSAEECTLYVDTSGDPLYQRGLRQKTVDAPLKENLAAGILRLCGWQPGTPLLDPMCGSGTFLMEAVQIAHQIAPGARRTFGFEKLKIFQSDQWKKIREKALSAEKTVGPARIYGRDISPVAVRATLANLDRAGLLSAVSLETGDILEMEAPDENGVMVANPPYGERLSEQEALAEFYPVLASALKKQFAGWNCWMLTSDLRMPKLMRLSPSRKVPLFNGALECRLFEFKMVAGSNRPKAASK